MIDIGKKMNYMKTTLKNILDKYYKEKMQINITILVVCIFVISLIFFVKCDCQCISKNPLVSLILKKFSYFTPVQKENIVASFNILWSVSITVTIFILEISERYKYGVPLKRIVYLILGNVGIFAGAFGFLLLFPLFYICMKFCWMWAGLWCLCVLFAAFIITIAFFAWIYKGKNIRKIVQEKTWSQIINFEDRKTLHEKIDGLAISTILDHIDYSNMEEVSGLIEIFRDMFQKPEFWKKLYQGKVENVIITTWLDHMIHSCDWNTEYECTQNITTMRILWENIMDTISKDDSQKNKKEMSVCIQFLQPFINANDRQNDDILVRIWREYGVHRKQTIIYMLLYTTYRLYRSEMVQYTWVLHNEPELRACIQEVLSGSFWWDETFAMQCWLDWSRYECRKDINVVPLQKFINDMGRLRNGKWYEVKTSILVQIAGGMV